MDKNMWNCEIKELPTLNSYTLSLDNASGIRKKCVAPCPVTYQTDTLTAVVVILGFLWNCLLCLRQTGIGFGH